MHAANRVSGDADKTHPGLVDLSLHLVEAFASISCSMMSLMGYSYPTPSSPKRILEGESGRLCQQRSNRETEHLMELSIETRQHLEMYMRGFRRYVEMQSGDMPFKSFVGNRYLQNNEEYKNRIFLKAQEDLAFSAWEKTDIGEGAIAQFARKAVSECGNLVDYHQVVLCKDVIENKPIESERLLYKLYCEDADEEVFKQLTDLFGKKYDLIAYLYFLKDESLYLPIRTSFFDNSFALLGIDYVTSYRCSWENYQGYIGIISSIREALESYFGVETRLIDAHSFVWMLDVVAEFLKDESSGPTFALTESALPKSKDVTTQQRIGQDRYRAMLIEYWGGQCAVSGCKEVSVLVASHIKPWRDCVENNEWIDPFNGLLLSPNIDAVFDKGFITFDENGRIVISKLLSQSDAEALGISSSMTLRKNDERHQKFLAYHRSMVFMDKHDSSMDGKSGCGASPAWN